jgi:Tol biopolymer transport system component
MPGNRRILPLAAAVCLLCAGCSQLEKVSGLSSAAGNPEPSTAFVLSLSADSIYLVDPTSGRLAPVATNLRDPRAGAAAWSPGHRSLAYGDAGVLIYEPGGDATRTLVDGQGTSSPAWSPKGKQIAYGDGVHMWVTPVSKPDPVELAMPETLAPSSIAWLGGPEILFGAVTLDCANPEGCLATGDSDVWTVRPDGTELQQITFTGDASAPKWAPGGAKILYVRSSSKKKFGNQLWVQDLDGTSGHQVADWKNVVAADWSPDGSRLVVVRLLDETQILQLWVGGSDGSGLTMVATTISRGTASVDW